MPINRITLLLAEDHQILREGFRALLEHEPDMEVVGEAETGRQAVLLAEKLRPAIILMDIAMPLLNGFEATRQIRSAVPDTKVIVLTAHNDEAYEKRAAEVGASGFLPKETSSHRLTTTIREIQKGNRCFSRSVLKKFPDRALTPESSWVALRKNGNHLSSREVEVLQMIAEGRHNKQVAVELGVSFKTVDNHRQHLMAKLNIHDIAGLTRYAVSTGIIQSEFRSSVFL